MCVGEGLSPAGGVAGADAANRKSVSGEGQARQGPLGPSADDPLHEAPLLFGQHKQGGGTVFQPRQGHTSSHPFHVASTSIAGTWSRS